MCETYNLVELNTAVKPYFFSYIFENFVSVSEVIYLDPDIQITSNLDLLQGYFTQSSILLTPHFSTPHIGQAGIITTEQRILQRGMYNLGFIGIKNDDNGKEMLDWWQRNLKKNCVNQPEKGLFVDQKWIDLVPLYFKQVAILKKLGLDIAYWNLYENQLHKIDNIIFVGEQPLRFYHFSAYQKDDPKYLSRLLAPFNSEMTDIMTDLYLSYHQKLIACGLKDFQKIPCHYQKKSNWFSIKKSQLKKIAAILRK